MAEKINALPKSVSEYNNDKKGKYRQTLSECESDFEKKIFVIELGIPNEEYQRVHLAIKKAIVALDNENVILFLSYTNECNVYMEALLDHCNTSAKNIL